MYLQERCHNRNCLAEEVLIPLSSFCSLSLILGHISPGMMAVLQRTLKLRAILATHCSTFSSWALTRQPSPGPHRGFQLGSWWHVGVSSKRLHADADRPTPSPEAAPDRLPFSRITEDDLAFFRKILPGRVVTDPDLLDSNNKDWLQSVQGDHLHPPSLKLSETLSMSNISETSRLLCRLQRGVAEASDVRGSFSDSQVKNDSEGTQILASPA